MIFENFMEYVIFSFWLLLDLLIISFILKNYNNFKKYEEYNLEHRVSNNPLDESEKENSYSIVIYENRDERIINFINEDSNSHRNFSFFPAISNQEIILNQLPLNQEINPNEDNNDNNPFENNHNHNSDNSPIFALDEKKIFKSLKLNILEQIKNLEELNNKLNKDKLKYLEKKRNLLFYMIDKFEYKKNFEKFFFNNNYSQVFEFKSLKSFKKNDNKIISTEKNFENIFDLLEKKDQKDSDLEIKEKMKKDNKNQIYLFDNKIINSKIKKEEGKKNDMRNKKYLSNYKKQNFYY
jgi:hypothetical protein